MKKAFKNYHILIHTLCIISTFLFAGIQVYASEENSNETENIILRESWVADENLVNTEEMYVMPSKISIIPIPKKEIDADTYLDVSELYYYFSTRSGFGDLPFHYVVTWDGNVFEGNSLGTEASVQMGELSGHLFIGYLFNGDIGFSFHASEAFKSLLLDLANNYAIPIENIDIFSLSYSIGEKGIMENISLEEASDSWKADCNYVKGQIQEQYNPQPREYNVEVVNVSLPEEELDPTTVAQLKITVKNTGNYNIYAGAASNLFIARTNDFDARSSFYDSESWATPSRIGLLGEGDRFVKDEEREFTFSIYVPLFPPSKKEDFVLVGPQGNVIAGSEFSIEIGIKKIDKTIIEITNTPVGYLNVRATPGLGEIVTKVSPGERFIVLDYQSGYYKIEANGKEGWVVNMYVKTISQ